MNSSELLLILLVAVVVFGPTKLPMLATHLGILFRKFNQFKSKAMELWQNQLNQLQLQDNQRKADEADERYKNK